MPTTRWSIVQALGGDSEPRQVALEMFARNYWPAVYGFIRRKGHNSAEAEDLTQDFLLALIARDAFEDLTAHKGRFRSWLLASLTNFLRNDWRDRNRLKRGGGVPHLSIDRDLGEAWLEASSHDSASPDVVFDRSWACGILERAMAQLTAEYQENGRPEVVRVLAPMIAGHAPRISFAEAGRLLGLTEDAARRAGFRMRQKLRVLIRSEVSATVADSEDIDAEIDELFAIFETPAPMS